MWGPSHVDGDVGEEPYLSQAVLDEISSAYVKTTDAFSPLLAGEHEDDDLDGTILKDRISRHSFSSGFGAGQLANNSAALTTFLLLNTMVGSGILNQPYVFYKSGVVGASLAFVVASLATWVGLLVLTEVGIHANVLEYSGLAKKAFAKNGERLIDVAIVITGFGSILGYVLVVGTTLSGLLVSWGCSPEGVCSVNWTTCLVVGLLVTPICLFRHFGHLAILSLFSVLAIVAVLLLVVIGGPLQYQQDSGSVNLFDAQGMLASTGSIVFSLSCASANFQAFISTAKEARTLTSWMGITAVAVFVGAGMCAAMGISGYLSFRDATDGEILDNFSGSQFDFFKVMVVCHLILYIPVAFVITRYSFVKLCFGVRSETLPTTTHTLLSVAMMAFTTLFVLMMLHLGLASGQVCPFF